MAWQYTPFTLPLVFATLVFIGLAVLALVRFRDTVPVLRRSFVALSAAGAVWTMAYALQLSSTGLPAKLAWSGLSWVGIAGVAIAWPVFVLAYAGHPGWVTKRSVALLAAVPVVWLVVLFSGVASDLIATDIHLETTGSFVTLGVSFGPLLLAFIGYTYLVDLLAAGLLGRLVLRSRGHHRRQAVLVFLAGTLPFVTGWVSLAGLGPYPNVDLTPVSFAFTSVVVAAAIFRYSLLDIAPVVRDTILRELDIGLVILDARRRVVDINELAGEILDVDPASTIGVSALSVFDGDPTLWDRLDEQDRVLLETDVGRFEATLVRSDRVAGTGGVAILFRDVTELMSRQAELERQNARLDEFASILAHDLRNPLNVAEGRLTLTRETGETDHLDAVERALARMVTLIDDLLELAQQGERVSEREAIGLGSVAWRAWDTVATAEATLDIVESVDIEADPNRLTQLFENLFRNAVEHAGPDVTVRVGVTADGFYVEDDGPGIPQDRREAVFDGGYSTGGGGVGMGLAIVREIANAHGWSIAVSEGTDGGARFECDGVTFADSSQPENVSGVTG